MTSTKITTLCSENERKFLNDLRRNNLNKTKIKIVLNIVHLKLVMSYFYTHEIVPFCFVPLLKITHLRHPYFNSIHTFIVSVYTVPYSSQYIRAHSLSLYQRFSTCAPRSPKDSACTSQGLRGRSKKIK